MRSIPEEIRLQPDLSRPTPSETGGVSGALPKTISQHGPLLVDTCDFNQEVMFVGRSMSKAEYEESCRNLKAFFDILRNWVENDKDEKEAQS